MKSATVPGRLGVDFEGTWQCTACSIKPERPTPRNNGLEQWDYRNACTDLEELDRQAREIEMRLPHPLCDMMLTQRLKEAPPIDRAASDFRDPTQKYAVNPLNRKSYYRKVDGGYYCG
mmetsp:Transcript_42638/g.97021  ORF Transcript_42638/g.97021 Transcript_42638/m.97021 type:complete len:118 (+) Transcript_42638:3-356(+)